MNTRDVHFKIPESSCIHSLDFSGWCRIRLKETDFAVWFHTELGFSFGHSNERHTLFTYSMKKV